MAARLQPVEAGVSGAPAFVRFWPDRWDGGTKGMSPAEKGAYVDLLMYQAQHGSIPADSARQARIAGMDPIEFSAAWDGALRHKFEPCPDGPPRLMNPRMGEERQRALGKADASRKNGRKGGRPAQTHRDTHRDTQGDTQGGACTGSGSGSSSQEKMVESVSFHHLPWVGEVLREFLAFRLAEDGDESGLHRSQQGWAALAQKCMAAGEPVCREAMAELPGRRWKTLPGAIDAIKAARAKRGEPTDDGPTEADKAEIEAIRAETERILNG